jgi:hypothetical protein
MAQMNISHVLQMVAAMGWPDPGEPMAWRWWWIRTWTRLDENGWFDDFAVAGTPGHDLQQRLTVFALRWIQEDFCDAIEDYENVPYWEDWLAALAIDANCLLHVARGISQWPNIESKVMEDLGLPERENFSDDDLFREAMEIFEAEKQSALRLQAVCLVAAQMRHALVKALDRVWSDRSRLFASMWACTKRLDSAGGNSLHVVEEDSEPELEGADSTLSVEEAMAINQSADAVFTEPITFDPETGERLNAFIWVIEGCNIRVRGYPGYLGLSA